MKETLCTKFALAGFGLSTFSSSCKKWTTQCEVCVLKKKVTVRVGHFSFKSKMRRLKYRSTTLNITGRSSGHPVLKPQSQFQSWVVVVVILEGLSNFEATFRTIFSTFFRNAPQTTSSNLSEL